MSTAKRSALVVLLASAVLIAASPAYAAISITNNSFESPTTNNWTSWDISVPTGWVNDDITNRCGVINIPYYKGSVFDANLTGYAGNQGLLLDGRVVDPHVAGDTYQNVGSVAYASNATLTVAVGRESASANAPAPFTIALWSDTNADSVPDTTLASTHYAIGSLSVSALQDFSVTANNVAANTNLYVRLSVDGSGTTTTQTIFDNVRVSTAAVPEPGTLTILIAGMIGLVCYAWRKRK